MRFWWLYLTAWLRGLRYRWPAPVPTPDGYTGVSWSLVGWRDCLGMYRTEGRWEPWALRRVRGYGCAGWNGYFRVPMTEEEKEYERIAQAEWTRQADEYYGSLRPEDDELAGRGERRG